jgi:hypothetical protein
LAYSTKPNELFSRKDGSHGDSYLLKSRRGFGDPNLEIATLAAESGVITAFQVEILLKTPCSKPPLSGVLQQMSSKP